MRPVPARAQPIAPGQVSARELQILALRASGRSRDEVAEELGLAELTVKSHLARIFKRTGTTTSSGVVAYAMRRGWIWPVSPVVCHRPTERQLLVLQGCADDRALGEIARSMFVTIDTVKTHLKRSAEGLGVRGRTAQVAAALSKGWIR